MKLSGITPESVQEAIQLIDQKKLSVTQLKSEYQVMIEDRTYPFKLLVETAYRIATGNSLPAGTFKEYFYLIKQFQQFTGYTVKVSSPILFRKEIGLELNIIRSSGILLHSSDQNSLDLSLLGPDINDPEIRKRKFRNEMGPDDIKPNDIFFLVTDQVVYGLVKVIADESFTLPQLPVRTALFLEQPLEHGLDFSEERYPIFECHFYGNYFRELITLLDRKDPELVRKVIEGIKSAE
jgi:hypothetical protein